MSSAAVLGNGWVEVEEFEEMEAAALVEAVWADEFEVGGWEETLAFGLEFGGANRFAALRFLKDIAGVLEIN